MYIQNKYIQLHNNQSVAINLIKVSVFDLFILHRKSTYNVNTS